MCVVLILELDKTVRAQEGEKCHRIVLCTHARLPRTRERCGRVLYRLILTRKVWRRLTAMHSCCWQRFDAAVIAHGHDWGTLGAT